MRLTALLPILLGVGLVGGVFIYTKQGGRFPQLALPQLPFIGKGQPQPITLNYWGLWEKNEVLQGMIDEYQRAHPGITINYTLRDPKDHFQTVRSRLTSNSPPDIVRVHVSWVPFLIKNLAPLPKEVMEVSVYEDTFYPINKKMAFSDNRYHALPLEVDGLALIYNADLFAQAGLNEPPATWDKFREDARLLTKKDGQGNLLQAGAALGWAKNVDHFSDILGLMFAQNGVTFEDALGKVKFHQSFSPDGRNLAAEALTFYSLFASSEKSWDPTWENSTLAFANGKVAMILVPSFQIFNILNHKPNLNLKVAPAPQLPGTSTSSAVNWGSFWVEVVPKKSPNAREAWRFLKFLTEKETLTTFYRTASQLRAFGEPYSRMDLAETLSGDQYTAAYANQGKTYTTWYLNDATYDILLNDKIIAIFKEAVDKVAQGAGAEGALSEIAPKVQGVLDELRKP